MWRIAGLLSSLIFSMQSFADLNCSAGELSVEPFSLKFERPYQICRENPNTNEKECATTQTLSYDVLSIGANQLLGQCGLKGSELALVGDKLSGKVYSCRGDRDNGNSRLSETTCETRKSQDGNYDLIVCAPTGVEQIITMVFHSGDKDRKAGMLLLSAPGNDLVITVNELYCGEGRRHYQLKPHIDPRNSQDIFYMPEGLDYRLKNFYR